MSASKAVNRQTPAGLLITMANVSDDTLKDALRQRRKHIESNLECVLRCWYLSNRQQAVPALPFHLTSV